MAVVTSEESMGRSLTARLARHNGAPTVFVHGKPVHFGAVAYRNLPGQETRYCENPHSFTHSRIPTAMALGICEVGDQAGIELLVDWFDQYFRLHPDSLAGCHIGLDASRRWVADHPEEMTGYDRSVDFTLARVAEPSWASEVWRADSSTFVEQIVRTLHERFCGRIILYQVGSGACHENVPVLNPMTGYYRGGWYCSDFSQPMVRYFRRWLRSRYGGDVSALRKAWSDQQVQFESACVPNRLERLQTEWFSFRSPLKSQTADYYHAASDAVDDCILLWAKAVKRASNGEALTASPAGSILDAGVNSNFIHQLLKNSLKRALQSTELDMLQSPASYLLRDLDIGDTSAMIPLGSVKLAGKMWLRDLDSRTSVVRRTSKTTHNLWQMPQSEWEDVQLFKRDVGYSLLKGGAFWWHEIDVGMYGHELHQTTAERLQVIGSALALTDRSTPPGLAILVDDESNFRQANANRLVYAMNYESRQMRWSRSGMSHEIYHIDDISHPEMPAHPVVMATNLFSITDAQLSKLHAFAQKHQATIIWLIAPGLQTEGGFDMDRASRVTGFRLRAVEIEAEPLISLIPSDHPWSRPPLGEGRVLQQFGGGLTEGDDRGARTIGPIFYADVSDDPDAVVLGTLDILGKPGLLVREDCGAKTVYCAAPYLHQALLSAIGRSVGAHLYVQSNDVIHATSQLLLLKSDATGRKQIHWPRNPECVLDLWTGERIVCDSGSWQVDSRMNETHLFFAGPEGVAAQIREALSDLRST
jgi:hypothetical protein